MLAKATIVAGVLLAGLITTASAQTSGGPATTNRSYEPTGNFQALWGNPSGASTPATRDASSRQSYAKQRAKQTPSRKPN
ncbi:hypothetical protein DFP91_5091 [Pseudorhodoplanes sinuspersici]|nr:hypothetical protein DFP91_5091 [Pseudorhodoplanes sinuspersici]